MFPFLLCGLDVTSSSMGQSKRRGMHLGSLCGLSTLRLVTRVALCTCIMMDKMVPAPLLLMMPALMLLPHISSDLCLNQSPLGIFSIPLEEEKHTALSRLKKEGKKIGGYHFTELCQGHASGEFYSWTSYKFLKSSPACVTKLCSPSAQPPHDGGEWQQGAGAPTALQGGS